MSKNPVTPQKGNASPARASQSRSLWKTFLLSILFTAAFIIFSVTLTFAGVFLYVQANVPAFQQDDFKTSATTFIYDQDGQLITQLHGTEHRIPVPIDQIPTDLRHAVLAVEDSRFYQHPGFDLKGLFRAALVNYQVGSYTEGGSTITQQLVKNVYLSSQKTLERKVKELYLAFHLERNFTKDQIFEMYLNRIYFGEGAYGVAAAAQTYFNKDLDKLKLHEYALLAGLPKNPTGFSPIRNADEAKKRRNNVLSLMAQNGFITEEQYQNAKEQPIEVNTEGRQNNEEYPYGYFLDHVLNEMVTVHGITEDELFRGGYRIYTSLDPKLQESAEKVMSNSNNFPNDTKDQQVEGAVTVLDAKTGEIKALVGGRSYKAKRGFNRATQLRRQPGSAIKPLVVYAPAFEKGYTPGSVLPDEHINFNGYEPKNYDDVYRGRVSIRQAVGQSINTTAVILLKEIGVDYGFVFGQQLGLPLTNEDRYLSMALGGLYKGVSPLEMAVAYAPFANGGMRVEGRAVVQIYDQNDKPLLKKSQPFRVMKDQTAYWMNDALRSTVQHGTGTSAQLGGRPVAGKTGTTELPQGPEFAGVKGNKDAWFLGYTPQYVCSVWMGYDKTDAKHYMYKTYGGTYPAQIFRAVMETAHEGLPVTDFPTTADTPSPPAGGPWDGASGSGSTTGATGAQANRAAGQPGKPTDADKAKTDKPPDDGKLTKPTDADKQTAKPPTDAGGGKPKANEPVRTTPPKKETTPPAKGER